MILIVMKIFSAIIGKVKEECSMLLTNYKHLQSMENEKLMKPTIRRAFYCMKLHLVITSLIFGLYDLAFSSFQDFAMTLAPLIIMVSFLILIFKYAYSWLEKALSLNRIILATNVFFVANFYVVTIVMSMFTFMKGYSETDKIICMLICFIWIVYSFNLVPGMLSVKLSLYLIITVILFVLARPKLGYGFVLSICHVIGYIVQIYLMWQKYHEDCQILNKVYEKNIYEYLQTHFPEAVFTLDSKLNVLKTNEQGIRLLQLNKLSYFKDFSLSLINDRNESLYSDITKHKEIENAQYSHKSNAETNKSEANESYKYIASSSCFEIDNNMITILIVKDFTEFFKLQEKNIIERFQNILLFSVPHEIRSQLNLIYGNLEQLEKSFDKTLLKLAKYAAKVMEYKLNLLFDFAGILTNNFASHLKKFNLKILIEEAAEIIKVFAKAKNLGFALKYKSNASLLLSDYERFLSILIHCCLNAIKYTREGFVKINISYKNGLLIGKIKDSGIGIKAPIVNCINNYCSNPFSDNSNLLKNSLKELENSKFLSGIGSLASAFICQKLGGSLIFYRCENKGTKVIFQIKCSHLNELIDVIEDESCIPDSQRSSAENKIKMYTINKPKDQPLNLSLNHQKIDKFKIIVVDDQSFNRTTLIGMLKSLKLEDISESENGDECVNLTLNLMNTYDHISIFMDIDMPIMNGIDATFKIKKYDTLGKVRIVMLSAFNSQDLIEDSLKAGAEAFFVKPISFKKLKELKDSNFFK